ncbi:MAG: hypothetical protein KGH93_03040 [Patescibacteria group bacterium]|nr:hypothetical protein [Patescibacteria group bacterium]MDE1946146.1 hypothetical protein [Patescibacteria group bacterium]
MSHEQFTSEEKRSGNKEQLVLSQMTPEKQEKYQDLKKLLEQYRAEVIDKEQSDFFKQDAARRKVAEFRDTVTQRYAKTYGTIPEQYLSYWLIRHVLEGQTLPEKKFPFDDDHGHIEAVAEEMFASPEK